VQVQFYGHSRTTVAGATTLQVKLYSGFGTAQQQERSITLRLRERNDSLVVGEFEVARQ
jgi:Ca-activated chloride channel family protein